MKSVKQIYIYDGTFINLLTLCDYLLEEKIKPLNIKDEQYNPNLFDELISLKLPNNKLVLDKIHNTLGSRILKIIYYVFLSSDDNKELIVFYFYLNALKLGFNVIYHCDLKCVSASLRISSYVSREAHKLKGFLRFKELQNNVLYAEYESTNNVIEILVNHFRSRLKNEYFLIHDKKRNIIGVYDKHNIYFVDSQMVNIEKIMSSDEEKFSMLWKDFYNTIGIKERKNDRCRMNFMPKKYWQYISEVSDE